MAHTISLQYMKKDDEKPAAGYEFTDASLDLPAGMHVPRVGEFMQLLTEKSADSYVVLAVNTRLVMFEGQDPGWHTVITLGPGHEVVDQRLLIIRE